MQLWLNCVTKSNKMAKLIIKSYQSRGWLVPILGENFQKITNYCSENGEDLEWFCPNTNEETYREIIEDFDVEEDLCGAINQLTEMYEISWEKKSLLDKNKKDLS
jgi:hypothetical protein